MVSTSHTSKFLPLVVQHRREKISKDQELFAHMQQQQQKRLLCILPSLLIEQLGGGHILSEECSLFFCGHG